MDTTQTTTQKALKINLDDKIYGTFAEIGAGQEVVGHFFKAGAASGTVAKSISAYDMIFSDSIYGKEESGRYVCQSRLEKMLKYEYDLLIERLHEVRPNAHFFSFANTISARNFYGTNLAHGWLGIRFRHTPDADYSEIILHVKMFDNTNILQQKAIGILGVNLIYTAFFHQCDYELFLNSLMEGLTRDRIEIDMIKTSGPGMCNFDDRLLSLQLVKSGFTDAILFDEKGKVTLASDELYKKNIMVVRGSYRPPTYVNLDMIKVGKENFSQTIGEKEVVSMAEITISNLKAEGELTGEDFLARVDLLNCMKSKVLLTNFPQYFRLTNYFTKLKAKNIAIVLGAYNFKQIFEDEYSQNDGGTLEALGRLFRPNVKVLVYPYREAKQSDELIRLANIPIDKTLKPLLEYIKSMGNIQDVQGFNDSILHIYSRKVLNMIVNGEKGWEQFVPPEIARTINDNCLFGHPCDFPGKAKKD